MPKRFEQASYILPPHLRKFASELPEQTRAAAEEIRLRAGLPMRAGTREGPVITARDLQQTLENASQGSVHTVLESLRNGFITVTGGHRVGVCGSVMSKDGQITVIRDISSLCIRVAREKKGIADRLLPKLTADGKILNTLILSPPGVGKTTLLRDLVRLVSNGSECMAPMRVSVADERGEIAAVSGGFPQLDVGRNTDVMTNLAKSDASVLLRAMSPQVLALDEVTAHGDAAVITECAGCGVTVLSTAHAACAEDLRKRPVYADLLGLFERVVVISGSGAARTYSIQEVS